jgi:hypothetical protein
MGHRYGRPIEARQTPGATPGDMPGAPAAFSWRGVWYQVDEVLSVWRLRDRWWAAPSADVADVADGGAGSAGRPLADALLPTERAYYRVLCRGTEGEQVFDLYYDAATGQWMLDRVQD